ncbi:MAG: short-chain dehydrogenase/reductase [Nitrososphaera sp.]|nr:short-chain dehydrogenase/reductase [Nitrososphaera sp.]
MKTIVVTGASSGIGRAAVIRLAGAGYRVYGLARNYDKLKSITAENYTPFEFDITKPDKFGQVVKSILDSSDGIYGLVNNAGYVEPGAIEDLSMDNIRLQFETNFFGLVGFTKAILPYMMQRNEGRIINVSSIAGLISLPLVGAYCASKHALEAVCDALCMELWNTSIKVVNINPGVIDTNIHTITESKADMIEKSRFAGAYRKYLQAPRGLPASVVADYILQAMSDNPQPRYLIGSGREKLGTRLRPLLPDKMFYSQVSKRIHGQSN